jgi:hypothetical protein
LGSRKNKSKTLIKFPSYLEQRPQRRRESELQIVLFGQLFQKVALELAVGLLEQAKVSPVCVKDTLLLLLSGFCRSSVFPKTI